MDQMEWSPGSNRQIAPCQTYTSRRCISQAPMASTTTDTDTAKTPALAPAPLPHATASNIGHRSVELELASGFLFRHTHTQQVIRAPVSQSVSQFVGRARVSASEPSSGLGKRASK